MQSIVVGLCLLFASGGWTTLVYDLEFELVKKTPREVQGSRNYRGERVGRVRRDRSRPLRKSQPHHFLNLSACISLSSLMNLSEPVFLSLKWGGCEDISEIRNGKL